MANQTRRLATNVPGDFYVDDTCIDCEACRWIAPSVFEGQGEYSRVYRQPANDAETVRALMAELACPTSSIGTVVKHDLKAIQQRFPEQLEDEVYYCGYHSEDSFGAASYLILRPEGNWLIDSPRFVGPLVKRLEQLGGIRMMFLTHRDDVADHSKFREHFGCERIIHARDAVGSLRAPEHRVTGSEAVTFPGGIRLIPVPGHTAGSMVLHYRDRFLFTGDHAAWSPSRRQVTAFHGACWYSWPEQIVSMEKLLPYRFGWLLPGHGWPIQLPETEMAESMRRCVQWMKQRS